MTRNDDMPTKPAQTADVQAAMSRETQVADLVAANHILYDQGVVDAFGHVSVRCADNPERFLLSRSMAPSLVGAADIIEYDFDGQAIDAAGRASYLERFIHAEIFRSRADVVSIVHSHSSNVIPFCISSVNFRPVYHMAAFVEGASRFEIRDRFGDGTDMLVGSAEKGRYLAQALGSSCVTLMRGHGVVAVGHSLQEAVFRAVYTEINAKVQIQAIGLGGSIDYLSPREAAAAGQTNATQYSRSWTLWKTSAAERRGSLG